MYLLTVRLLQGYRRYVMHCSIVVILKYLAFLILLVVIRHVFVILVEDMISVTSLMALHKPG